jgi:hypothetical protein
MSMKARNSAWVLFAVVSFGLGILLGCDTHGRSVNAAKPAGEVQPLFTPVVASMAQQKMCDEQAAKKFHETKVSGTGLLNDGYTSHYDPKVNVCYARLYFLAARKAGDTRAEMVLDAFEGREYATYVGPDSKNGIVKSQQCQIFIPGKHTQDCQSIDEFDGLVEKYFGVTK